MRIAALLIVASLALAEAPVRLNLQQAIETALRQNPSVITAKRMIEEADARIREARAGYYPQLGFNGIAKAGLSGATNELGLIGLPNSPFYRNFADSLNTSQLVLDFGRVKHRVAYQRKRKQAAEAALAVVEADCVARPAAAEPTSLPAAKPL